MIIGAPPRVPSTERNGPTTTVNARQIFNCQRSRLRQQSACRAATLPDGRIAVGFLVGLGGIEPPTSPLSGVRSSHLSYRPSCGPTWWSWSGSNRRPPECKSGALPAELQPLKLLGLGIGAQGLGNLLPIPGPYPEPRSLIEASWMQWTKR